MNCTCAACLSDGRWVGKLLGHAFQTDEYYYNGIFVPCEDEECGLNCPRPPSQEDMLCDDCRDGGGISRLATEEIVKLLDRDERVQIHKTHYR